MSENESKTGIYELGVHLTPELEEVELEAKFKELQREIEQNGGIILSAQNPQKQRLSYPLKRKRFSFLGFVSFRLPPASLKAFDDHLKLRNDLLRFLIIRAEENQKVLKSMKDIQTKVRTRGHLPTRPAAPAAKEPPETGVIEKQIEELIEKI